MSAGSASGRDAMVSIEGLSKRFVLHAQGGIDLEVLRGVSLQVRAGECVALNGPSGVGKSTLLRLLYGNYKAQQGSVRLRHDGEWVELVGVEPRTVLALRRRTVGYVSQFLRAIPRVPALDIVAQPGLALGETAERARARAASLLARLNLPERLWQVAPATFSGGEQQRVNIAHGFAVDHPILLLDEPTASLDAANRAVVIELIREARARGAAVIGVFHHGDVRAAVADRVHALSSSEAAA